MRAQTVNFERGKDPKVSMGIGLLEKLPEKIFEEDRSSGYWNYRSSFNIQYVVTANRRMSVEFEKNESVRIPESKKIIAKDEYVRILLRSLGVEDLFVRVYQDTKATFKVYATLKEGNFGSEKVYDAWDYYSTNESIEFKRGQDPKKSMGIGMTPARNIEKAVRDVASNYGRAGDVEIYEPDPENFSAGFHYRNCTLSISIDNDEEGMIYSVGMEDDSFPSSEHNGYKTIEEAKSRMEDWITIVDEHIEDEDHYCEECGEEIDDPDEDCPYCQEEDEEIDESGITGMHL